VQDFTGQPLSPRIRSIAQAFQANGYATGAVVSSFVLDRSWGLARGFASYNDAFNGTAYAQSNLALVERPAAQSVDFALTWLRTHSARPFFFWLHLYDPHSPYDPPEPFRTRYHDHLYDGEIAYADSQVARVIALLKARRAYDRTLIVVLSDHGESLGDHGEKEHGFFIYNSTIRVPLIVKLPSSVRVPARRFPEPVSTIAVAPTLLSVAGLHDAIEKQFEAGSLLERSGQDNAPAIYSETFYPFRSFGWSPLRSLETERYHYIQAPQPELYDLHSDPDERTNIIERQSAVATVLRQKIDQLLARYAPEREPPEASSAQISPDAAEKLAALGYMAYRSPVSAERLNSALPDPKEKLEEFNSILSAADAFAAGQFDRGSQLLASVQQSDPNLYLVPFMLGEAELRQRKWEAATANLQRAVDLNPNFDQAITALARALHESGRDGDARRWIDKALQLNPQNYRAWYELAWLERGDPDAALDALHKVLTIQPNFALALRDSGVIESNRGNYAAAAKDLGRAAQLGITDPPLFNLLGIAYSRTSRLQDAVRSYQRALAAKPDFAQAHLNLGFAYERLNQPAAARTEYAEACRLEPSFCKHSQ
jgi:tetratricopeptide (TPR) repeat protein